MPDLTPDQLAVLRAIDWPARRAAALIPFDLDADGLPVNPGQPHLPEGPGNLPHWGEQPCGDVVVFAYRNGVRHVLLGVRSDGLGVALPGGKAEPGEDLVDTAIRECGEETGLRLFRTDPHTVAPPRYVPDARAGRRSWMVTVVVTFDLGPFVEFPTVTPQPGEFDQVFWAPANTYQRLVDHLSITYGIELCTAHRPLLADALARPS